MITYEEYAKIRDSKNLTDGKIAKICGFGRSTFSDWKSGKSKPKADKMVKIANALEVDYTEFIGPVGKHSSYRIEAPDDIEIEYDTPISKEDMIRLYTAYMGAVPEARELVNHILKFRQSILDPHGKQEKTDK